MVEKVFVFGCPGSGKSTASSYIEMIAQDKGEKWSPFRINDYKILDDWFHAESTCERFRPSEYGGFDILVPEVYDEALRALKNEVQKYETSKENELIIIEFARCDYQHALEQLGGDFMQNAYFLFLNADIKTCTQRIYERVRHQITLDDHFVSDFVLECYDQPNYVDTNVSLLKATFRIDDQRIKIVGNSKTCTVDDLYNEMKNFVNYIVQRHSVLSQVACSGSTDLSIQLEEPKTKPLMPVDQLEPVFI